jgi:hypothetical protein
MAGAFTVVCAALATSTVVACAAAKTADTQRVPAPASHPAPPTSVAAAATAMPAVAAPEPTLRLYLAALTGKPYPLARTLAYLPQESNYFTDGVYIHHGQVVQDVSPLRIQRPAGQAQNLELAGIWPPDNFFGEPPATMWAFSQRGGAGADQHVMFYERTSKGWRERPNLNLGPAASYAGAASWRGRLLTPHVHTVCEDGCTGEPPKWHTSASRFVALSGGTGGLPVLPGGLVPVSLVALPGERLFALVRTPTGNFELLQWDEHGGAPRRESISLPSECGRDVDGFHALRAGASNDVWLGIYGGTACLGRHDERGWAWSVLPTSAAQLSFDVDGKGTAWVVAPAAASCRGATSNRAAATDAYIYRITRAGDVARMAVDAGLAGAETMMPVDLFVDDVGEPWFFAVREDAVSVGFALYAIHPVNAFVHLEQK